MTESPLKFSLHESAANRLTGAGPSNISVGRGCPPPIVLVRRPLHREPSGSTWFHFRDRHFSRSDGQKQQSACRISLGNACGFVLHRLHFRTHGLDNSIDLCN